MRARRSTLVLAGSWIAIFVLYLFVKPDEIARQPPAPAPTVAPASPIGFGQGSPAVAVREE
ncbi:hypothetical protein [Nocardia flavorosea]|uniref:Uncharacterized protein n=1 Tax=Nocardia flavorosea TaxID=53429 RepID=A0A846YEM7_9NOCA|nr:hypothetical protein [Nocardia flavorosea]NKY55269.1 hypothetical protein [Nocardia flavorosea]